MEPVIQFQSRQEICATWGATMVRICDGIQIDVDDLQRVDRLYDGLLANVPAAGDLLVITHDTPMPTPAARRYAVNNFPRYSQRVVVSIAVLGLGFWASTFRAGLSATARLVHGSSVAIEGSVEAAVTHLTTELIGIDPLGLQAVYEQLWLELERERRAAS